MRAILLLSLYKIKAEPVPQYMSTQSLFINTWGAVSKVTTLWRLGHLISGWSLKRGWTAPSPPTPTYTASLPVQLCPLGPSVFINSVSPHKLHLKSVREKCHKKWLPLVSEDFWLLICCWMDYLCSITSNSAQDHSPGQESSPVVYFDAMENLYYYQHIWTCCQTAYDQGLILRVTSPTLAFVVII